MINIMAYPTTDKGLKRLLPSLSVIITRPNECCRWRGKSSLYIFRNHILEFYFHRFCLLFVPFGFGIVKYVSSSTSESVGQVSSVLEVNTESFH